MRWFLCVVKPNGEPIPDAARPTYLTSRCRGGGKLQWKDMGGLSAVLSFDEISYGPSTADWKTMSGVGVVRLDNRRDLERSVGCMGNSVSDLELVLRLIARDGPDCVVGILGDFAFVAWDRATRQLLAACDAFGVRRLYYASRPDALLLASRAELLSSGDEFDREYIVTTIAACRPPDRSVYAGVSALPAGSMMRVRDGTIVTQRFWSASEFASPAATTDSAEEHYARFRDLFSEAVRGRLTGYPNVWATLSGGLDSSSVVSMAQHLARVGAVSHGVSGTVSWVYRWSKDGDEREYSNEVARAHHARNEVLDDVWLWQDDGAEPPQTDQPDPGYALYARDRRTCSIARQNGGEVLLTGFGSDDYLIGNMFFFADWIAAGRIGEALREMIRRAAIGRVSFWNLAYQNALLPLLPQRLQQVFVPAAQVPSWIEPSAAKRYGLTSRQVVADEYSGRIGHKYADVVLSAVNTIPYTLQNYSIMDDMMDLRHPFLYRPLVEFALRLPPEMCVQPNARKWVLRQAMRGILPEAVRRRAGKGSNGACLGRSLLHEWPRLDSMLKDPLLAQLGCINAKVLQQTVDVARRNGDTKLAATVIWTLAVETWLQVRSGRWPAGNAGSKKCMTELQMV